MSHLLIQDKMNLEFLNSNVIRYFEQTENSLMVKKIPRNRNYLAATYYTELQSKKILMDIQIFLYPEFCQRNLQNSKNR